MQITITFLDDGTVQPPDVLISDPVKDKADAGQLHYVCSKCAAPLFTKAGIKAVLKHDHRTRLFWAA
jgi:hypothetical protein